MHSFIHASFYRICHNRLRIILVVTWLLSFFIGAHLSAASSTSLSLLVSTSIFLPVSFTEFYCIHIIPVMLCAVFILLKATPFLLLIAAVKAFSIGYSACSIFLTFTYGGWLVSLLVLFSAASSSFLLIWLMLRHIEQTKSSLYKDFAICALCMVLIGLLDLMMISPFLNSIANTL